MHGTYICKFGKDKNDYIERWKGEEEMEEEEEEKEENRRRRKEEEWALLKLRSVKRYYIICC